MFLIISLMTLLEAYLNNDMSAWQATIDDARWETLCDDEKINIINTEYGYIATLLDEAPTGCKQSKSDKSARKAQAQHYLDAFINHIEDAKDILPESRYCMYLSGAYAYKFMLTGNISAGVKSFQLCHDAVEKDPKDPLALTLVGNVEFYAPKLLGGSKKKALEHFNAAKTYIQAPQYDLWWNKPALYLCLIQCYEKMGQKEKALTTAKALLQSYPNFIYLRDTYLPQLEEQ